MGISLNSCCVGAYFRKRTDVRFFAWFLGLKQYNEIGDLGCCDCVSG